MARYEELQPLRDCARLYDGTGTCVATESGVGCDCDAGTTARRFIDLDGQTSTTCVPDTSPVDLSAGGLEVPYPCATIDCGDGIRLDIGGFPTCQCGSGYAGAQSGLEAAPVCEAIIARSTGSGAHNSSAPLADLQVCAPAPPNCGVYDWNVPASISSGKRGFDCTFSNPSAQTESLLRDPVVLTQEMLVPNKANKADEADEAVEADEADEAGCVSEHRSIECRNSSPLCTRMYDSPRGTSRRYSSR